ncbi:nucleolar protein 8 [Diretmus argenteus]
MRRLYVGGLSHSITQKDLKDRFGKFGDVEDVEVRTRRDEQGIPYKTFGYINIDISDADLKKCLTVLNKSKWKGGTLQIETAKQSFLHRLDQERQASAEQNQQPPVQDQKEKLLDSLRDAGVENFHMKAAVPGTEVPGHKDWVVSKFGRVLPVLQLRCQKGGRSKTIKYDPSKHSHNIRKLDPPTDDPTTPVAQLTWEIQGGDDDISKKRRGEFPPCKPQIAKRSRTDSVRSHNAVGSTSLAAPRCEWPGGSVDQPKIGLSNGLKLPTAVRQVGRKWACSTGDMDSDKEIHSLVVAQQNSQGAPGQEVEEDNLEVVGYDYLVNSGSFRQQHKGGVCDEEDDYDSADTDELLTSRKPPSQQEKPTPPTPGDASTIRINTRTKKTKKAEEEEEDYDSTATGKPLPSRKPPSNQHREDSGKRSRQAKGNDTEMDASKGKKKKAAGLPVLMPPSSESDGGDDDNDDGELESADSSSDGDYEAMFSNCTRLEISLADLQKLAKDSSFSDDDDQPESQHGPGVSQTSKTTAPSIISTSKPGTTIIPKPAERPVPKKGTTPEEILAAILEEDSSEDERKKKKKRKGHMVSTPLPAFQGTRGLMETTSSQNTDEEEKEGEMTNAPNVLKTFPTKLPLNPEGADSSSSSGEEAVANQTPPQTDSSSSEEEEEDGGRKEALQQQPSQILEKSDSEGSSSSDSSSEEEEGEKAPPRVRLGGEEEEELQRKANLRRLAAVEQRQKETEQHKRLIQGALANIDAPTAGTGKHIVFGSDDDDDDEEDEQTTSEVATSKTTLFQDSQSDDEASGDESAPASQKAEIQKKASQLFGSSEEEDGEEEDEEDRSRFQIRPQFEGRAGNKLMALQSRFGTDERFRMDSRFLEEDGEEEKEESDTKRSVEEEGEVLEEEKRKNLSILQSVLNIHPQPPSSNKTGKTKTFRDVSALHYDPSREEHAAFETTAEEIKKESKATRRKKREEAEKLPEVSKDIYYNVTADLKEVFGPTMDGAGAEGEKISWDQEEEEEGGRREEDQAVLSSLLSADPSTAKEPSSGFKFSFFGDEMETGSGETAEYRVETIQGSKLSWQRDPRFHDSSSEEEEEEHEEEEEQISITAKITEEKTPSKTDLFFFYPEDDRLTEGPRLFCGSSQQQREEWEEKRSSLIQEYRKKHRDARRKLRPSQRS